MVGCIDDDPDQAQAITKERKLEIAQRSHRLLTEKYGVPEQDIIFDPLVFPAGTGDENYVGSAAETIEGVRIIKEALPNTKTVLGISNVSFGLPAAGREVFNSVFLYHCTQAGLDMAIVNSEMMPAVHDDTRGRAPIVRRFDLEPGRRPGGRLCRALPRPRAAGHRRGTAGLAAGRTAGAVHH